MDRLLALIAMALMSSVVAVWQGEALSGLLLNLGSEMAGVVVTYTLLELVTGQRQRREAKKADPIAKMSSCLGDVAVPAADELRRRGWFLDGALQRADLTKANLRGVSVTNEQLANAQSLEGTTMPDGTKHD